MEPGSGASKAMTALQRTQDGYSNKAQADCEAFLDNFAGILKAARLSEVQSRSLNSSTYQFPHLSYLSIHQYHIAVLLLLLACPIRSFSSRLPHLREQDAVKADGSVVEGRNDLAQTEKDHLEIAVRTEKMVQVTLSPLCLLLGSLSLSGNPGNLSLSLSLSLCLCLTAWCRQQRACKS